MLSFPAALVLGIVGIFLDSRKLLAVIATVVAAVFVFLYLFFMVLVVVKFSGICQRSFSSIYQYYNQSQPTTRLIWNDRCQVDNSRLFFTFLHSFNDTARCRLLRSSNTKSQQPTFLMSPYFVAYFKNGKPSNLVFRTVPQQPLNLSKDGLDLSTHLCYN